MSQDSPHEHAPGTPLADALRAELLEHLPFSVSSVAIGLIFAGLICYLAPENAEAENLRHEHDASTIFFLFHLFHPAHMFFSAAATTAMFYRYDRNSFKAVLVGIVGSVGVCGISDIGLPHLSLVLMGQHVPLHVCLIENPSLVLPFAVMGVLVGLGAAVGVSRSTLFSHSLHVLASTAASIFYLIAPFSPLSWVHELGKIFVFVIIAVMGPCCASDIVFPLLMTGAARRKAAAAHHH